MTNLYPESPGNSYSASLQPTALFKLQIVKVIGFILLFLLLYVIVLLTAVVLSTTFVAGGAALIGYYPSIYTFIIGPALMVLGGTVLFFLIKFLFYKRPPVNPYRTQIDAAKHPRLFDFLHRLVKETRISFPEKIFVVPEVNATVFYNSSFLSLLWPARKNLEIGLGLINSVNISELKMVLAHEFAHFSRRSMKLGSYVYTLNKVLYNMLYENDSWNEIVIRWSSNGSLPGFFAHATTLIVHGMQYLLRKLYHLINRQYLALSREMEFQADAVAVALAGTTAAISGMRRMEMGSYCLDHCMHKLPELESGGQRFKNIFRVHRALIRYFAGQNNMKLDAVELPVIPDSYFHTFLKSRVQLRQQWTSHPTREDREERYIAADVPCEQVTSSAWLLFNDPETVQETGTQQVYEVMAPGEAVAEWVEPTAFINDISQRHSLYEYPKAFNDYYDNRSFPVVDITNTVPPPGAALNLSTIYHPDIIWRMRSFYRDQQDVETLQAIASGQFQTRVFEFDGQQNKAQQARILAQEQAIHVAGEQQWLQLHDQLAYQYHYQQALKKGEEVAVSLQDKYQHILLHQEFAHRLNDQVIRIIHGISQVFNIGNSTLNQLQPWMDELTGECWQFRRLLHEVTTSKGYTSCLTDDLYAKVTLFRQQECVFMQHQAPDYVALQELHDLISAVMEQYNNSNILLKKSFLEFLLTLEPSV